MAEHEALDWRAVGDAVVARRKALNRMTQEDLSAASGVSISVVAEIEQVKIRRRVPGTLERLSRGLRWLPSHLDDILCGRPTPPDGNPESPEQILLSIRDELDSLSGRVDALLSRYDIVWHPRQSSDVSVELETRAHGHEPSTPAERGISAKADE